MSDARNSKDVSEMGLDPTPPYGEQNFLACRKGSLQPGAQARSAALPQLCRFFCSVQCTCRRSTISSVLFDLLYNGDRRLALCVGTVPVFKAPGNLNEVPGLIIKPEPCLLPSPPAWSLSILLGLSPRCPCLPLLPRGGRCDRCYLSCCIRV